MGEIENVKSIVKSDSEIVKLSVNVFSQATTDETTTFCLEPFQNFIKVLIKSLSTFAMGRFLQKIKDLEVHILQVKS